MKVAILHLSDIHIEKSDDWICNKGEKIAKAVIGTWERPSVIFIVISGDVANKGISIQYSIAYDFLIKIKEYIEKECDAEVYFIVVPGNHDCNLSGDLKARNSFIETVLRDPSNIIKGDSIYDGCLSVQKEFFIFANNLDARINYPSKPDIFYQVLVEVNNRKFYFNIFNTAWLSKLHEEQGKLVFPLHLIEINTTELSRCVASISIFHHPENWLDSTNSAEFRKITEHNSDIILSGHEHTREVFYKRDAESNVETQIIRADALQERDKPESSSFNLVVVNLDSKKQKLYNFKWQNSEYKNTREGEWQDFVRNGFLQSQSFYLLPEFESYITSLNSIASHNRKRQITLDDFFIAPRLYITSLKNIIDGKESDKKIESKNFFDFIYENRYLLIFGETWQGKTTTAKKVFKELYDHQYAPVLIDGSKFEKVSEVEFKKILKSEFSKQFSSELFERFVQMPKEKRALVIDNFGHSNINQKSLQQILQIASEFFSIVVAFAHNNLSLQQFLQNEDKEVKFSQYVQCKMLALNQTQVTELIRRWIRLEVDSSVEDKELVRQENQLRVLIQNAGSTGLIILFPFYIIGILQLIDSYKTNPNAQFGSIGYVYQSIITSRLADLKKTNKQIDQLFLIVSIIAHWVYKNNLNEIEEDDLGEVIKKYNKDYKENIYLPNLLVELRSAQILIKRGSYNWTFVSSHHQDFFIAKYYAQALGSDDPNDRVQLEDEIKEMIETLTYDPHARILLFLVYLANSNQQLMRWILNQSKRIYSTFEVANFDSDVKFLNKLQQEVLGKNLLESDSPKNNQDKLDEFISNEESIKENKSIAKVDDRFVKYADDMDEFHKISVGLKMIELVGQLVKNFAGSIKAQLKQELIEECIAIGLRVLRSILEQHGNSIEELNHILKHLILQQHPQLKKEQLASRTEKLLIIIHHSLAYGVIKKISLSVGHEDLKDSFNDVFQSNSLLSYKLVETAIKLDHYDSPVADKLIKFGKEINENKFANDILKRLIADYVNYFEVQGAERQKLVDTFSLTGSKSYLLTSKSDRGIHLIRNKPRKFTPPERNR